MQINGYDDRYEIYENGDIWTNGNRYNGYKKKIMKTKVSKRTGYEQIILSKDGSQKTFLVHRLVAQTFIPNPDNKPEVNHKDGNKLNNSSINLEWSTSSENIIHGMNTIDGFKESRLKKLEKYNDKNSYKLVVLSNDILELEFESTKAASEFLETSQDNITRAFRKSFKCKGFDVYLEK